MKKIIGLLSIFLIFSISCSSIGVRHDSFKNATIVSLEMDHEVVFKSKLFSGKKVSSKDSKYVREIKNGKKLPAIYHYRFQISGVEGINETIFIKIDDEMIEMKAGKTSIDSQSFTQPGGNNQMMSYTVNYLNGTIVFTSELEKKILKAKKLHYRLYNKDIPIDVIVFPSELEKIKEFLNTTGKKK